MPCALPNVTTINLQLRSWKRAADFTPSYIIWRKSRRRWLATPSQGQLQTVLPERTGEKNTNKPTKILLLTHIKNLFFRRSREGRNRNRCEEICMYQYLLVRLYNHIAQERCYVMLPWDLGNWAKALSKQIYESEGRSQAINTAKSHGDTGG